ncbi:ATP-grasp domain-containing protein [Thalassotalea ganghwensis]
MAHLLIIENWVEGTGRLFPKAIHELGHSYTFVTRNRSHYLDEKTQKIHPVIAYADNVLTTETNDTQALIAFLKAQHHVLKFDGVSTVCDYYVETVADVAKALNLPQAFSSNVGVERRKHLVRLALDKANLPNPKFAICTNWQDAVNAAKDIGYPLIIKPSDLASSAHVTLAHDETELKVAFDTLAKFTHNFRAQARDALWLLEEYMEGEEVSVEAVTFEGKTHIIGITDKSLTGFPYFIEDGHMFPADLPSEQVDIIVDYVTKALAAVGHDNGISHTEVKLTEHGPRLVEINPRPGGNYIAELIQAVTGIDFLDTHIKLALAQAPDLSGLEQAKGSAAVKFLVPLQSGKLVAIHGQEQLSAHNHLLRWDIKEALNQDIYPPIDNACYLGFAISRDQQGQSARAYAEAAISSLIIEVAASEGA